MPALTPAETQARPADLPDRALWQDLTADGADPAFGAAWLALCRPRIQGAQAGALILLPGDAAEPVLCTSPAAPAALLRFVHGALQAGRGTVQPGAPGSPPLVAYPVQENGNTIAAAGFVLSPEADPRQAMRELQWAAGWLRDWRRRRDMGGAVRRAERAGLVLDLLAAVLDQPGFTAACRVAATELAVRFGCERVAIGLVRRHRCQVAAISHSAQFGRGMALVRLLADAMDEAVDGRGPVLFPEPPGGVPLTTRAHAALAAANAAAVLTVPLFVRDHFAGAVTFERPAGEPLSQSDVDLADAAVAILGPALLDKRELDRPLPARAASQGADAAMHLFGPSHWGSKLAVVAIAIAAAFGWFAHGPYRVAADARLEGAVQRATVAPFDGFVAEALVKAGDTVHAGQALAMLDDRDLVLERLRWLTERQQHLAEYDGALATGQRADAARFRSQGDQASAQMRLIDEMLARTRLVAPFDGLVVSGDLSQSIGAPVRRGDVLFELAPLDDYRIVLRVDESQIADVSPGQHGALLVSALPGAPFPMTVTRVTPVAEAHEGRMQFQVDAQLDAGSPRLRPGMEGLAKVDAGRARMVWTWFRAMLHWAQLESWAWLP